MMDVRVTSLSMSGQEDELFGVANPRHLDSLDIGNAFRLIAEYLQDKTFASLHCR